MCLPPLGPPPQEPESLASTARTIRVTSTASTGSQPGRVIRARGDSQPGMNAWPDGHNLGSRIPERLEHPLGEGARERIDMDPLRRPPR